MVKVKICCLTNDEDVRLAQQLGADYAGFVLYPKSPRYIEPEKVKDMIRKAKLGTARALAFVGVFVNEEMANIRRIFADCRLDIVQLQGDETPEYCREIGLPFWKAVRLKDESSLQELGRYPGATFLLDAFVEGCYGGSGRSFDPALAKSALDGGHRIIIAGGLSVDNLPEVLALRPFAVDACSSLEARPGKKSEEKMRAFFRKIQEWRGRS